jgi:tripartite-type tricarboxylate transporter receptor subunit TctC
MHPMKLAGLVMAAAGVFTAGSVLAQGAGAEFPVRPIRIVVPFAPGGGTDITARIVGQRLNEAWGQPVVNDNRPGAGTMLGTEIVQKAPPDGYTMMIASASHALNPSLYRKVHYDPLRDFQAVTLAVSFSFLLAANPSLPAQSVRELVALAKAQPGKLTFASSGTGSTNHLAGELFRVMAGLDLIHVPYKGGGPAMNDVIGGQVSYMFGTVLETLPQARAGRLRALAVSSGKRASFAPELPTVAEAGVPGFDVTGWYAFLVPAATPKPVVERLNREITRILDLPAVRERFTTLGAEPWPTPADRAQAFIGTEVTRWRKVIQDAGIRAD